MNNPLDKKVQQYIQDNQKALVELLDTLCRIPAPSNKEEQRAAYIKEWLEKLGAKGVYIDDALNVVYPVNCEGKNDLVVLMSHTDTVFPDMTPFDVTYTDDGWMACPGVGDDTANVAVQLMVMKYILENNIQPKGGVLFVLNSGEEGLGNLKGTRQIMKDYEGRVKELVSFDGSYTGYVDNAVGSHRYQVTVKTEGGHSYGAFGNRNAIHYLASMIDTLYTMKAPTEAKTTYNVGLIEGGTSVNTIAQNASMLYEFRSESRNCLAAMEKMFNSVIESYRNMGIEVEVEVLGIRPCTGDVDPAAQAALVQRVKDSILPFYETELTGHAGSTDCNIPLSMGIPAICFGFYKGQGAHTRAEKIEIASLEPGFKIGAAFILSYFN